MPRQGLLTAALFLSVTALVMACVIAAHALAYGLPPPVSLGAKVMAAGGAILAVMGIAHVADVVVRRFLGGRR